MSAVKALDNFRDRSSYRTWLCAIAKHKIIDFYRKEISCDKVEYNDACDFAGDNPNIEDAVSALEVKALVVNTLRQLSPIYRYTLILKYVDELSVNEISTIIGKTPKAVDGILQRARYEFKKKYINASGESYYEG